MARGRPYDVDYGKPKKKSFGFFKFLLLVFIIALVISFFSQFNTDLSINNKISNSQSKPEISYSEQISKLEIEVKSLLSRSEASEEKALNYEKENALLTERLDSLKGQIVSLNKLNDMLELEVQSLKDSRTPDTIYQETETKPENISINKNETILLPDINLEIPNLKNKKEVKTDIDKSKRPKIIATIEPKYPRRALERRQGGSVSVIFDIDIYGNTTNIRIQGSTNRLFDSEAKRVVRSSKFEPALDKNGVPVYFSDFTRTYEWKL